MNFSPSHEFQVIALASPGSWLGANQKQQPLMSLVLIPRPDATDDYHVMHGELQVGQIYKRKAAIRPEARWLWAVNGLPKVPNGPASTGLAATLDQATAALTESWSNWLASAALSEAAAVPGRGP